MEDILLHNSETLHSLSSEGIFRLLKSAIKHAEKLNVSVSVSILDKSGRQIGFCRMPKSPFSSDAVAKGKAYAAVCFKVETSVLEKKIPFEKIAQLMAANKDEIVVIEGGRPILFEETLIGAIGVSGATSAQDDEIAGAAIETYLN
jgi:uncharacterized protein GlcG (DUF336 family)